MSGLKKIVVIGPESTGKSTLCQRLAKHYCTIWCAEYAREYLTVHGASYTFDDLLKIAKGQAALEDSCQSAIVNREWTMVDGESSIVNRQWSMVNGESSIEQGDEDLSSSFEIDHSSFTTHHSPPTIHPLPKTSNQDSKALFIDTDLYVMKVWCEYVFNKCHAWILEQIACRKYDLYLFCNIDLPWEPDTLREYPDEKPRQELYRIYKDILLNQATPWVEISGSYAERLQTAIGAINKLLQL